MTRTAEAALVERTSVSGIEPYVVNSKERAKSTFRRCRTRYVLGHLLAKFILRRRCVNPEDGENRA